MYRCHPGQAAAPRSGRLKGVQLVNVNASNRIPYDNIIDADGHILEPPDVWEKYIDPKKS